MLQSRAFLQQGVVRLCALKVAAGLAFGQTTTTGIHGIARDPSGAVVPNANITLRDLGTGIERTVVSTGEGNFAFANLQAASYREGAGLRKRGATRNQIQRSRHNHYDQPGSEPVLQWPQGSQPHGYRRDRQRDTDHRCRESLVLRAGLQRRASSRSSFTCGTTRPSNLT